MTSPPDPDLIGFTTQRQVVSKIREKCRRAAAWSYKWYGWLRLAGLIIPFFSGAAALLAGAVGSTSLPTVAIAVGIANLALGVGESFWQQMSIGQRLKRNSQAYQITSIALRDADNACARLRLVTDPISHRREAVAIEQMLRTAASKADLVLHQTLETGSFETDKKSAEPNGRASPSPESSLDDEIP